MASSLACRSASLVLTALLCGRVESRRERGASNEERAALAALYRDAGTVLDDDSLPLLEARRHRLGEDVEKHALGLGLLEFECVVLAGEFCQRSLPRPHEVLEQRVCGRRHAEDVEREERDYHAVGNMGRASGEGGIDRAGDRDEADEGNEPGDGLTRSHEQQCPSGDVIAHRHTAEDVSKPPRLHCKTNGSNRLMHSWLRRNRR
jgi:hypothetical protein